MKTVFLIVGESGCGKTTICNILQKKYGYKLAKSSTTRAPRYKGESSYNFVTIEEYHKACDDGEALAPTIFDNNYYFITRDMLYNSDLYVVDKAGVDYLKNKIKDIKFIAIYISVDETTRRQRMLERGDSLVKIENRVNNDREAFKGVKCDYVVENIDLELCIAEVLKIMVNIFKGLPY